MIKKLYIAEKPSLGRAIAEEIGVVKKGQERGAGPVIDDVG